MKKLLFGGKNTKEEFYRLDIEKKPLCQMQEEAEIFAKEKCKPKRIIAKEKFLPELEIYEIEPSVTRWNEAKKTAEKVIAKGIKKAKRQVKTELDTIKNGKQLWENVQKSVKFATQGALVSMVVFTIGFTGMNYQALTQIAQYRYREEMKPKVQGLMTSIFNVDASEEKGKVQINKPQNALLKIYKDPIQEKRNIPKLNLNLTPPDNRIYIPKMDKNVPIVKTAKENLKAENWDELQKQILGDLKKGVVHFPGTANPWEKGNVFITGHSSYYPWDDGKYKDVFALLGTLEKGDEIIVYYNQNEYRYRVSEKKEVSPKNLDILRQTDDYKLTLMTCVPVGTNLRRLVVSAELIQDKKDS